MKITCRLYSPDDIDALVSLWNENAEWGIIDREQWEKVFYHTPFGPSTIILATDPVNGDILAQFVFIPTKVYVNGEVVKAFKPCAPIVRKTVRELSGLATLFDFILKMYRFATKHFVANDIHLLHIMPDPRWVRGFQLVPGLQLASFPLWCLSLDREIREELPQGYAVAEILPSDPRINTLWEKFSRLHDCSIVRDSDFFSWKLSHRDYHYVAITHEDRVVGFSVFIYKDVIRGIIICDVLAEDEAALKLIIQVTTAKAYQFKKSLPELEQPVCEKVSILATPLIQDIVIDQGFVKNSYKFSLGVHVLSKALSKKALKPENWYVSAND
jgi:hypothetical protein